MDPPAHAHCVCAPQVFLEVVTSFTFPWFAFFTAEALELSGIVAILFCGIVFATYTRVNVSEEGLTLMAGVRPVFVPMQRQG